MKKIGLIEIQFPVDGNGFVSPDIEFEFVTCVFQFFEFSVYQMVQKRLKFIMVVVFIFYLSFA
jgi:hypothetical protein